MENIHLQASKSLMDQREALTRRIVDRLYHLEPGKWQAYQPAGYPKSLRDMSYHFSYLAEALAANDPSLFMHYIGWAKVLFAGLKFDPNMLSQSLQQIQAAVDETLPADQAAAVRGFITPALTALPDLPDKPLSNLNPASPYYALVTQYLQALLRGDRRSASQLVLDAVQQDGVPIKDIYIEVFQPCMREIGLLWQTNQISVAQEHFATAATQMVMSQFYPYIFATEKNGRRLLATSISGDLHEMGMRMVSDFLELDGWDTYYLGANTPPESVLSAIADRQPDVVAISATIIAHVSSVQALIQRIREQAAFARVKILVGGYPFNITQDLWQQVGADGYARDAEEAVAVANRLVADAA